MIAKLLSSKNWLPYFKPLAQAFNDTDPAILLSELANEQDHYEDNNILDDDGFFYATAEKLEKETCLSPYRQSQAIAKLEKAGLIETKLKGLPATKHFKFPKGFENKFSNFLKLSLKNLKTGSQKFDKKEKTTIEKTKYKEEVPPKKTAASSLSPSKQETEKQALIKFLEIGIKNSALLAMCEGIDQTLPEIREKFADYWFGLERSFLGSEGDKRYVKNSLAKWAEGEAVNCKKSNEKATIRFDDKLEKVCEVFKFYSPRSQSEIRKEVALTIAKKLFKDGVTIEELDIEMSKIEFLGSDFRDIDGFFQRWEKVVKIRPESWEVEYGIKGSAKPVTKYQRKNGAA